jgi:hypothetical protein
MDNDLLAGRTRRSGRRAIGSNTRRPIVVGLAAIVCAIPAAAAIASSGATTPTPGLGQQVRDATRRFRDVDNAVAAGYASAGACVSGPEDGAMGIHYSNSDLLSDGELHADQPELLVYEQHDGSLRLVGVEYLVLVDAWHAAGNTTPPVLVGQHFQFVNSPNRYGIGAFYELHVWAWKRNPNGAFVDWNPSVSCAEYTGEPAATHPGH